MKLLHGKVAVVSGAGGRDNMGQSIARHLASQGAMVTITGRNDATLAALADEIGGHHIVAELTSLTDCKRLFDNVVTAHGTCDIAVNAAGMTVQSPALEITETDFDAINSVNLKGAFLFMQCAARQMAKLGGGSIIQISSATVESVVEGQAAYIAAKAGTEGLVRAFANELGGRGVRVNAIAPGLTPTPMTNGAFELPGLSEAFTRRYPLQRLGTSDDIARAVSWLASADAFITGQTLQVNGGLTLRGNPTMQDIMSAASSVS